MNKQHDPFTYEIIQNSIDATCDEMFTTMVRAAMSTVIYEVLDFGVAITDEAGNLASQGSGIPIFIGMLEPGVKAIIRKFGPSGDIHPGDVFISNDPWSGGASHLNDVSLLMPVFAGGSIIAWVADKAHWSDIGGMVPGSIALDATEVFQEGLQFPDIKIFQKGKPIDSVLDMIRANGRMPDNTIGDMWAGVAALRLGARHIEDLANTYGIENFRGAIQNYLDYGAKIAVQGLKDLPMGTFEAHGYLEGIGDIKIAVTVSDNEFTVDLRGNPKQVAAPANSPYATTVTGAQVAYKAIVQPHGVTNAGSFRPLKVVCDEGSLFAATRPSPVGIYHEPTMFVTELIWKALAKHIPDKLTAGHFGSVSALVVGGNHPETGKSSILIEAEAGGWGAGLGADGTSAQFAMIDGQTFNTPIEINEARNGVIVRQYALHNEDGGEGQFRGGRGVVLEYEIAADDAWTTGLFTPNFETRPWALMGGMEGSSNRVVVKRKNGEEEVYGKHSNVRLEKGDRLLVVTGHGGGYGDPKLRDRDLVRQDIRDGYITAEQADRYYGVRS